MRAQVKEILGDQSPAMIDLYRKSNPGATPSDIFFLIASDYHYVAPTMKIAERRAALGKAPVYQYYFTWVTPVQGGELRTPHNMEIPFAFDNVQISAKLTGGGPEAMALADKVSVRADGESQHSEVTALARVHRQGSRHDGDR